MNQLKVPEYIHRQYLAFARYPHLFPPGEVSNIEIGHDDWCGLLVRHADCDCDPRVVLFTTDGQKLDILKNGEIKGSLDHR